MAVDTVSSPLSDLLRSTRGEHDAAVKGRDYEKAKKVREQCFVDAEEKRRQMHVDIERRQDIEKKRLQRSKELAIQQVRDAVHQELARIQEDWSHRKESHDMRQKHRTELFERTVRAREAAKPVVLSSYVRDLQRSEKQLASFHMYEDAAQVRQKIQKREVVERGKLDSAREQCVMKAMERREEQNHVDESNFRAKVKNELQLAMFRAANEEERVLKKFAHIEEDMHHAHALELRQNPLLTPYQRPKFLHLPPKDSLAGAAGERGTQYLLRTQGSKYDAPALAATYMDGAPPPPDTSKTAAQMAGAVEAPPFLKAKFLAHPPTPTKVALDTAAMNQTLPPIPTPRASGRGTPEAAGDAPALPE